MATVSVSIRPNFPVALPGATQELRERQGQALYALGANALCPRPVTFPNGKMYDVKSEFGYMPRVKL
jgi:hypothetical protein